MANGGAAFTSSQIVPSKGTDFDSRTLIMYPSPPVTGKLTSRETPGTYETKSCKSASKRITKVALSFWASEIASIGTIGRTGIDMKFNPFLSETVKRPTALVVKKDSVEYSDHLPFES